VADIRKGGKDLTLRSFVKQFKGLSDNTKAKAVCDAIVGISKLSDCDRLSSDEIKSLLEVMQANCDPPAPQVLGVIGEDHFKSRLDEWYGIKRHWYKKVLDTLDGIPFVFEVFVAETEQPGPIFGGVNFSPTFDDPFAGQQFKTEKLTGYGIRGFLQNAYVRKGYTAAVFHLSCPSLQFLDRGKTHIAKNPELTERITPALWKVSKLLYKEEKRRQRAASSTKVSPISRGSKWTLKEAVFDVLQKAIAAATGKGQYPVSARTLYYQVRPLIQAYTSKSLNYDYFSQTLLTDYQYRWGEIEQLYYDPRGVLYEPHTGHSVPLGTREVDEYVFPVWLYNKILYVEKKGLWPILKAAELAERYDMAVVGGEGYASEAVRTLFKHADSKTGYQLFVLHDADPYGYNIARTLQEETYRMRGYYVQVIDLGLKIDEAVEMGLETEEFTRKNDLPYGLVLNEIEKEMFIGEKTAWEKWWTCQRVELNALSAPQLVNYIERKLEKAGAYPKVIPSDEALPKLSDNLFRDELNTHIRGILDSIFDVFQIQQAMAEKFKPDHGMARQWIKQAFEEDSAIPWKEALRQEFERHCLKCSKELHGAVKAMVNEAIA
jgi:hypothetical protein